MANRTVWTFIAVVAVAVTSLRAYPQAGDRADALAKAKAQWSRTKPASYEFTLQLQTGLRIGMIVYPAPSFRVANGLGTPTAPLNSTAPWIYDRYNTVDRLFARIEADLDAKVMTAYYDPEYGYPTSAEIDRMDTSESRTFFRVTGFKPLP